MPHTGSAERCRSREAFRVLTCRTGIRWHSIRRSLRPLPRDNDQTNTTLPGCVQTEPWKAATTRETALSEPPYSSGVRSGSASVGVPPLPEGKSGHTDPQANRSSGDRPHACQAVRNQGVTPVGSSTVHSNATVIYSTLQGPPRSLLAHRLVKFQLPEHREG